MNLPTGIEWKRFKSIDIIIDHFWCLPGAETFVGVTQAITSLLYGRPDTLSDITIQSKGGDDVFDPAWTRYVPARSAFCFPSSDRMVPIQDILGDPEDYEIFNDKGSYHRVDYAKPKARSYDGLDNDSESESDCDVDHYDGYCKAELWLRGHGHHGSPIVATTLSYFLALPPCKSVYVRPLLHLANRRKGSESPPRHDCQAKIFDHLYMIDLVDALTFWLEGKQREKVDLPVSYSEEPELEQLAYHVLEGGLHCDIEPSTLRHPGHVRSLVDKERRGALPRSLRRDV